MIGIAPLNKSPSNTIAAEPFPNVLNTFDVPGLPLPSEEISMPLIRAVI